MDNTPAHQGVDVGSRLLFQSPRKFPPQLRSNFNSKHSVAENSSDNQEPRKSTAPRRIRAMKHDPMLAPPLRARIGGVASAFNTRQQQQRSSQGFQTSNNARRGYPCGYEGARRVSNQDVRLRHDDENSQSKKAVSVASYFKDRHYSDHKNESF